MTGYDISTVAKMTHIKADIRLDRFENNIFSSCKHLCSERDNCENGGQPLAENELQVRTNRDAENC